MTVSRIALEYLDSSLTWHKAVRMALGREAMVSFANGDSSILDLEERAMDSKRILEDVGMYA